MSRQHYQAIEEFLSAPRLIGQLVEFQVAPMVLPAERLLVLTEMMTRP